jgi:hypothetical protein
MNISKLLEIISKSIVAMLNYLNPLYTLGRFPIGRGIDRDFFNF